MQQEQQSTSSASFGVGSAAKAQSSAQPAKSDKPQNRNLARVFVVVMALVATLGFGGGKLSARAARVENIYTQGAAGDGYSISYCLDLRQSAADNLVAMGASLLGSDATEVKNAQAALAAARSAKGAAEQYQANVALGSAVDLLYQSMLTPAQQAGKAPALQTQWSEFLSRNDIIGHLDDDYNSAAQQYNKLAGGFPANLEGLLWGANKVETFS